LSKLQTLELHETDWTFREFSKMTSHGQRTVFIKANLNRSRTWVLH